MTRSRSASAVATNQSRGVAASPSLPTASASLARTRALKSSISGSVAGLSAIGADFAAGLSQHQIEVAYVIGHAG